MTYERFRATVESMIDDIPDVFLQELQGVHALRDVKREDGYQDVWRMGEYLDPGPDDFLGGQRRPRPSRRAVLRLVPAHRVRAIPTFDWEEEIWETLTHELQHHVESLAGDGRLIEQDLLDAEAFERVDRGGRTSAAREDDGDAAEACWRRWAHRGRPRFAATGRARAGSAGCSAAGSVAGEAEEIDGPLRPKRGRREDDGRGGDEGGDGDRSASTR